MSRMCFNARVRRCYAAMKLLYAPSSSVDGNVAVNMFISLVSYWQAAFAGLSHSLGIKN